MGIKLELGDETTYPMTRIGTISFKMSLGVLELHDALFVPNVMKNLLFVSAITDLKLNLVLMISEAS